MLVGHTTSSIYLPTAAIPVEPVLILGLIYMLMWGTMCVIIIVVPE